MRAALVVLALALSLPFLATHPAVAQETCGPLTVAPPAAPAPIAAGGSTDLAIAVTNAGRIDVQVTVTASTTGAGWTLGPAPAPAPVPTTATGTFIFRLTADETATDAADVTFSINGACGSTLPTGCPVPQACQATPATTQVRVPLAAEDGFSIPFLEDLDLPIELLVAAVVLVGLASAIPFLMRRSKGGIVAQCPEPLKMVKPGRGTSFPIELRNGTKEAAVAQLEVGPVPEGWSAFMPLPEVQLAAREARSLWLMVRSPATATNGEAVDVELRLKDPRGKGDGVVKVRAEVQGAGEA